MKQNILVCIFLLYSHGNFALVNLQEQKLIREQMQREMEQQRQQLMEMFARERAEWQEKLNQAQSNQVRCL